MSTQQRPRRRRGRRPASEDTRAVLAEAARSMFAEHGYAGATVRGIAARAEVDPSMINHWFGGKQNLFAETVLRLPFRPGEFVAEALQGPVDSLGERILRTLLGVWGSTDGGAFPAIVRSVASSEDALSGFRDLLLTQVFEPLAERLGAEDARLRATLCATQLVGIVMVRYVLRIEPLASADDDTVVAAIAPNLQRYLTGSL